MSLELLCIADEFTRTATLTPGSCAYPDGRRTGAGLVRTETVRILPPCDDLRRRADHCGRMKPLPRPVRRAVLVVHVSVSVGWLGLSVGLLVLGVTAAGTESAATAEAAYRGMKIFGDWLVVPVSLLSAVSGLILSLGTPWGLARYRWVYTKFWITLATLTASIFALRSVIDQAAAAVTSGQPAGSAATDLVVAPSVATATYLFATAISVLKPWGLTRRGRRLRDTARSAVVGESGRRRKAASDSLTP